jgi:pimeloyl-ACP methyl ester carboxylesterase
MEFTIMRLAPLDTRHLPAGVHSRFVESVNGLRMHVLEAGHEKPGQPLLLLLHGFPEIAYCWRKIMVPLGYHVVAPDQRGYGRTTGWSATYDQDLRPYSMLNLARDAVALTFALGYRQAAAVIGHDFGAPVASWCAPESVGTFLRAYFHYKSADWTGDKPHPLASFSADELAKMPTYYVMDQDKTMAETVRPFAPSATEIAGNQWLPDAEIAVYAEEYERTGFQGGLNWYRASLEPHFVADLTLFSGKAIDVPSMFIAGQSDWGTYQMPGALDTMREGAFAHMTGVHLVPGAGHWVQQEQPESVVERLHELLTIET